MVDDSAAIRSAVARVLRPAGFAVAAAANGREALAFLRQAATPPVAVVLDLEMPVMNGHELRREMLSVETFAAIPVIVLSGSDPRDIVASRVLQKPFAPSDLLAAIEEVVGLRSPAG